MILRYPAVSGLALTITFGLFFIMQLLVATGVDVLQEPRQSKPILITRQIQDKEVVRIPPQPPVLEIDRQPPVDTSFVPIRMGNPHSRGVKFEAVEFKGTPGPADPSAASAADRDQAIAIVAIPPRYPQVLSARGIEGYVDVSFDITKTGAVANAVVTYSTNWGFERSALQAIAKWKFQPRVVDDAPQMQFGVEKRISYVLE